ncbi:MAG: hypothetical protein HYZ34_09625 [Ignavibacteriae bacterium]|nr:hypothetical protein [Ignavibacteriota bacterium]
MKHEFSSRLALSNPFDETLTIEFELPEPALVSVCIVDEQGKQVADVQPHAYPCGSHSIELPPLGNRDREFFYRLTAEMERWKEVDVKKIELSKK